MYVGQAVLSFGRRACHIGDLFDSGRPRSGQIPPVLEWYCPALGGSSGVATCLKSAPVSGFTTSMAGPLARGRRLIACGIRAPLGRAIPRCGRPEISSRPGFHLARGRPVEASRSVGRCLRVDFRHHRQSLKYPRGNDQKSLLESGAIPATPFPQAISESSSSNSSGVQIVGERFPCLSRTSAILGKNRAFAICVQFQVIRNCIW
jgi:hypothetical protein